MVEKAVTHVLQLLKDDCSPPLKVNHIRACLEKANQMDIAKKVFTNVATCIQTQDGIFEVILNIVSLAANVLNMPFGGIIVVSVIRLICKIFSFIIGTKESFSIISENNISQWSEKMKIMEEKLHAFCACFDARSTDLKSFKEEKEKSKGCVEKLLDDVNYKEIGMEFTGELEAIIMRYKNVREESILKSVGEILTVYVSVAVMRRMMQISILSIASDEEMEGAIKRMKMYIESDAKGRMDFLSRVFQPAHENAIFLSFFSITEFPLLDIFLKTKGFIREEQPYRQEISALLTNKSIALQPAVFHGHWMNSAFKGYVWSTSKAPHDDHAHFRFEVASKEENIFFIKSSNWKTYVYMKPDSFLSQTDTQPNEEGKFKFLRLENGRYLIAVVKYPCRFIYMQNTIFGRIKGAVTNTTYDDGLPSVQHEWSLKKV